LYLNITETAPARVGKRAGKVSDWGIALSLQGKANCENCKRKKSRTKESSFHVVLRSLTRGSLKAVLSANESAQAADFAGLLAWR